MDRNKLLPAMLGASVPVILFMTIIAFARPQPKYAGCPAEGCNYACWQRAGIPRGTRCPDCDAVLMRGGPEVLPKDSLLAQFLRDCGNVDIEDAITVKIVSE